MCTRSCRYVSVPQICCSLHCRDKEEPFSQLRFKGTLESHVSKPFNLLPLSGIYKTEVVHKSLRETHLLGRQKVLLGEEKQR